MDSSWMKAQEPADALNPAESDFFPKALLQLGEANDIELRGHTEPSLNHSATILP